METKVCKKCYQEKSLNQFHKCTASKDGFNIYCKQCRVITDPKIKKEFSERTLKWKEKNLDKWKINIKKAKKAYEKKHPKSRTARQCRKNINLKLQKNSDKYSPTIGCSSNFVKKYIESLFTPEMNWENKGTIWCIDHKIPFKAFDLTVKIERQAVNHYLNLQPLTFKDNEQKGSYYTEQDKAALIEKINKLNGGQPSI